MADTTDPKVAVLSIWNAHWNDTAIANLPSNVNRRSAGSDQPVAPIEAVVGDAKLTSDDWMNATEKLFKYTVDCHTFVRAVPAPAANAPVMATLKKQRTAINNNIRTIAELNPFRPTLDVFQIEAKSPPTDHDMRTQREIVLHSIQTCVVWIIEQA